MSNVLSEDKQQQDTALGRLGWSLRRIERETGVRRETAGGYLRAAGIAVRPPGSWGRSEPANPAIGVTTGSEAKPAMVTTGAEPGPTSSEATTASSCDLFCDAIELGLSHGRNGRSGCDVLQHYGAVAMPCRVRDPDRKGKVESGVGHAQKTPLKGLRFESLEETQAYLDRWEERCADTLIHGTTKRQVAAMFAEEPPALVPLPLEPFRCYQFGTRTVHLDGCVEVDAAYYGAPPGWIGLQVNVQWNGVYVRLFAQFNQLTLRVFIVRIQLDRPRICHKRILDIVRRLVTISKAVPRIRGIGISLCIQFEQHDG
jgi:hypothetical protein